MQVHASGVFEPWSEVELQLDSSRPAEAVELAAESAGSSGSGSGNDGGQVLHGLRYRLMPLDVDSSRPLPADGKVCAYMHLHITALCVHGLRMHCSLIHLHTCPSTESFSNPLPTFSAVTVLLLIARTRTHSCHLIPPCCRPVCYLAA